MPAPITHLALTEKVFSNLFKDKTKQHFSIGSLFPDIRYLKVIAREKTHYDGLALKDLAGDSSFLAGVKFHSILDVARGKFIVDSGVYSLCPESEYVELSLKIYEDKIFYQKISSWSEYVGYLNEVLSEEINFGIKDGDVKKWHSLLQQYFQQQPDEQVITNFLLNLGFSGEAVREINGNIKIMQANKKIGGILEELYNKFDLFL